jgi:hypothetical protein
MPIDTNRPTMTTAKMSTVMAGRMENPRADDGLFGDGFAVARLPGADGGDVSVRCSVMAAPA